MWGHIIENSIAVLCTIVGFVISAIVVALYATHCWDTWKQGDPRWLGLTALLLVSIIIGSILYAAGINIRFF